jgi:predicted CoA-binding protein
MIHCSRSAQMMLVLDSVQVVAVIANSDNPEKPLHLGGMGHLMAFNLV